MTYNIGNGLADSSSPSCNGNYFNNSGGGPGNAFCEAGTMGDGLLCGSLQQGSGAPAVGWHSEGSNFAFFDGHVKWLRGTTISPGLNPPSPTSVQSLGVHMAAGTSGLFASGNVPQGTYSIF